VPEPTEAARPSRARAAAFVIFAGAAFSVSGPLSRWARPTAPLLIAFGRLALAALILGAANARAIGPAVAGLSRKQRLTVLAAGALLAAHFACFQLGLDRTSLAAALSLVSLEPLAVVLTAWIAFGLRPSRMEQGGVLLAMAGAAVVAQSSNQGENRLAGNVLVLVAVALFGLYLAVARALKSALPAQSYAALVYAGAAAVLAAAILALPVSRGSAPLWPPPVHGLAAIALVALIPTVLGHTAVQTASRSLPPAIVALVSPGETLGGIALGALFLGARPTRTEMVGAAIILGGSALAILSPRPDPPEKSRSAA
jgi:drug/metabolite transporter (DMT)-like permease